VEAFVSVKVLLVITVSAGTSCCPGTVPESPNSLGLTALNGNCWPTASAPASFAADASPAGSGLNPPEGPLTVLRALDFEAASACEPGPSLSADAADRAAPSQRAGSESVPTSAANNTPPDRYR
jgi:hypothetical protein